MDDVEGESRIARIAVSEVSQYCLQQNRAGDPRRAVLDLAIVVTTKFELSSRFRETLDSEIQGSVHAWLSEASARVAFGVDSSLDETGCRVLIRSTSSGAAGGRPPAAGTSTAEVSTVGMQVAPQRRTRVDQSDQRTPATRPAAAPRSTKVDPLTPSCDVPSQRGSVRAVHLVLRYGAQFEWTFRIQEGDPWMPMGRGVQGSGGHQAVQIPGYASFVPSGALLYLRYRDDGVEVYRSDVARDKYLVSVDRQSLRPGLRVELDVAGDIEYAAAGASPSVLAYHLIPER